MGPAQGAAGNKASAFLIRVFRILRRSRAGRGGVGCLGYDGTIHAVRSRMVVMMRIPGVVGRVLLMVISHLWRQHRVPLRWWTVGRMRILVDWIGRLVPSVLGTSVQSTKAVPIGLEAENY